MEISADSYFNSWSIASEGVNYVTMEVSINLFLPSNVLASLSSIWIVTYDDMITKYWVLLKSQVLNKTGLVSILYYSMVKCLRLQAPYLDSSVYIVYKCVYRNTWRCMSLWKL